MSVRRNRVICLMLAYLMAAVPIYGQSDETARVSIGDVLSVAVPGRQDLNRELVVSQKGVVNYPLVGEVYVQGLTTDEARRQLLQAIRGVYPSVNSIDLKLTAAGKFNVYIAGAIARAGKYSFSNAPNLWDAIREAGGPTGDAALDAVRVVGDPGQGGESKVVDVQRVLDSGSVDELPMLKDGDSVVIPARTETQGRGGGIYGVDVYGSVVNPGTYRMPEKSTVVEALLMAGGTLPEARMAQVAIVRPVEGGSNETITVDVRKFLETGDPLSNPVVKPGDTVYVPRQPAFWWSLKNNAGVLVGLIGSIVTLALVAVNNN